MRITLELEGIVMDVTLPPSPLPSDVASLSRELFAPERFVRDNVPEPLTVAEVQRSQSHDGDFERLSCFLAKLRQRRNVTIGVVGGSVSAGSSSLVRTDQSGLFHKKMQDWLQRRFPGVHVTHFNAAMPAVPPNYMQHCLRLHVPRDADLVFLEAAANMCGPSNKQGFDECNEGRASVERMLRQLLRYPNAPAVVMVHAYPYWTMVTPKGWSQKARRSKKAERRGAAPPPRIPWLVEDDLAFTFHQQWGHGTHEHMVDELAKYYALPSVSLRDVIWHHMKANATFHGLGLLQLYYDRIHPSNYGHTLLALGLAHLFKRAALHEALAATAPAAVGGGGATAARCPTGAAAPELLRPMDASVDPASTTLECFDAPALERLIEPRRCDGWALVVERSSAGAPKPGWIATRPGATCELGWPLPADGAAPNQLVGIGYLKSYEQMGRVQIECTGGCDCKAVTLDAHHDAKMSPYDLRYLHLHTHNASSATGAAAGAAVGAARRRCALRLTVLNETSSGSHKFKLTALFLNRESDQAFFGGWIFRKAMDGKEKDAISQQDDGAAAATGRARKQLKRKSKPLGNKRGKTGPKLVIP